MKQDIYLTVSEKQHLKNQAMRLYKCWKVCKDERLKQFLAEQFNKVAEMYIGRTRDE